VNNHYFQDYHIIIQFEKYKEKVIKFHKAWTSGNI
jgi:hypothetical protein